MLIIKVMTAGLSVQMGRSVWEQVLTQDQVKLLNSFISCEYDKQLPDKALDVTKHTGNIGLSFSSSLSLGLVLCGVGSAAWSSGYMSSVANAPVSPFSRTSSSSSSCAHHTKPRSTWIRCFS